MSKVIVIGGGAAGCMAAIAAAENYNEVHIYEHNEKLGKKLFITGKGRCNVTNASSMEKVMDNVVTNKKFLYSAFNTLDNKAVMDFFEENGIALKTERGERVFPVTDKSSDIIQALSNRLKELNVKIHLANNVTDILQNNGQITGIKLNGKEVVGCDNVIVATGGKSYQLTGSDGSGYKLLEKLGHHTTQIYPALVPLETDDQDIIKLQGLSLKNVRVDYYSDNKEIYSEFGEMLFTHFGISGPVVLSASSYITSNLSNVYAIIDLKPALSYEQLDSRLLRDFESNINKIYKNSLDELLPQKLISYIIKKSGIDEFKKVNEITKEERTNLVRIIKNVKVKIIRTRGFNEAIITQGGINVREITPSTMESRLVSGLYIVGELLDVDALTGGYNLQIAWSTGYAAGHSIY